VILLLLLGLLLLLTVPGFAPATLSLKPTLEPSSSADQAVFTSLLLLVVDDAKGVTDEALEEVLLVPLLGLCLLSLLPRLCLSPITDPSAPVTPTSELPTTAATSSSDGCETMTTPSTSATVTLSKGRRGATSTRAAHKDSPTNDMWFEKVDDAPMAKEKYSEALALRPA